MVGLRGITIRDRVMMNGRLGASVPRPDPPAAEGFRMTDRGSLTQRGFFGSLFDLSFTSLVATKIIKVLHVLGLIAIVVSALLLALSAFRGERRSGPLSCCSSAPHSYRSCGRSTSGSFWSCSWRSFGSRRPVRVGRAGTARRGEWTLSSWRRPVYASTLTLAGVDRGRR